MKLQRLAQQHTAAFGLILSATVLAGLGSEPALANGRSRAPVRLDTQPTSLSTTASRMRSVAPAAQEGAENASYDIDALKQRSRAPITTN